MLIFCLLVIIGIILLSRKFELIKISGESMYPTLVDGEFVIIKKHTHYSMGDIVVLPSPDTPEEYLIVKRICSINKDGQVWLLGDNRENSRDSRVFGWVDTSKIEGRVVFYHGKSKCKNGRKENGCNRKEIFRGIC